VIFDVLKKKGMARRHALFCKNICAFKKKAVPLQPILKEYSV